MVTWDYFLKKALLLMRILVKLTFLDNLPPKPTGVIQRDTLQEFPDNLVKKMGALGFLGIMVDPKYGGSGMDTISYVLIMEELGVETQNGSWV